MATNVGKSRKGAIKSRSQVLNTATGHYIKRDAGSGQFLTVKKDGEPFKGVRIEKTTFKANPSVNKKTAVKIENAVLKVMLQKKKK
jgi:hypothetical protein